MKKWLFASIMASLLAFSLIALADSHVIITTNASVHGLMLMDENGKVISTVVSQKSSATSIQWTLSVESSGASTATAYERDAAGNWMKTDLTYDIPAPTEKTPAPTAKAWPEVQCNPIAVSVNPLPEDKRHQSRCGPSGSYHGAGAYKSYKIESIKALFVEGNYVLADLSYTTVGNRRVYFQTKIFRNLSGVPNVSLTSYPAKTTESLTPRFGPGAQYDSFTEAQISAGTRLGVLFEENGWAFAEFDCQKLGTIRAWIPAHQVN